MKKKIAAMIMAVMTVVTVGNMTVMAGARSNVDSAITNFRVEPKNYNQIAMREKFPESGVQTVQELMILHIRRDKSF